MCTVTECMGLLYQHDVIATLCSLLVIINFPLLRTIVMSAKASISYNAKATDYYISAI